MTLIKTKHRNTLLGCIALCFASSSPAALFTVGNLTYDDNSLIISGDGKEYLGFGVGADWTYAETLQATSSTGQYSDFTIANTSAADFFIGSLFGSTPNLCSTVDNIATQGNCGILPTWTDGIFGSNAYPNQDWLWFEADESANKEAGLIVLTDSTNEVHQQEAWSSYGDSNLYSHSGFFSQSPVSWLLVRNMTNTSNPVPEPSVIALLSFGVLGFSLTTRRKLRSDS